MAIWKQRLFCSLVGLTYCGAIGGVAVSIGAERASVETLLDKLQAVGPQGQGHKDAVAASRELAKADAASLPQILAGLDGAEPLAANWIRAAFETIAEREWKRGGRLPAKEFESFLDDRRHHPRARRLAYEWLSKVDSTAPDRWVPRFADDPSLELRRDGVARLIEIADQSAADDFQKEKALAQYQLALDAARDLDQIQSIAATMEKLGRSVDLMRQFGFVANWKLIGPFDNVAGRGFNTVYPPEQSVNLTAGYPGKEAEVHWIDGAAHDRFGHVDLNKCLGKHMGATGYAFAEFYSPIDRDVDIRIGTDAAHKIWVNGQLASSSQVYHTGDTIDQYTAKSRLKAGKNTILVKVCQNEQTEDWAQDWKFQLRVCDALGAAILSAE